MEKAGKTTLVHTLKQMTRSVLSRLFASHTPDARTKGIEITTVSVRGLAFSVWDYAGVTRSSFHSVFKSLS